MLDGEIGELARRIAEHGDVNTGRLQTAHRFADVGARPEMQRRAVGGEALEQGPPIAEPLVEHRSRRSPILGQVVERDARPARRVLEPVPPERAGVDEHGIEIERKGPHKTRC